MSINNNIKRYGHCFFFWLLLIIIIVNIKYDVSILLTSVRIITYILYYIVAFIGIASFYWIEKSHKFHWADFNLIGVIISSIGILIFGNLLLFVPIIALVPLIFGRKYHIVCKILSGLMLIPIIVIFLFVLLFESGDFSSTEVINEVASPDGTYSLVTLYVDTGALGGDMVLSLEKKYMSIIRIRKRLVLSNNTIEAEWIDNETIRINEKVKKVRLFP